MRIVITQGPRTLPNGNVIQRELVSMKSYCIIFYMEYKGSCFHKACGKKFRLESCRVNLYTWLQMGHAPHLVTYLDWTPLFECYMLWCGSKNKYQKGILCFKKIGVCAQNMKTVISSIVNIYDHLVSTKIFTLIMNQIFIRRASNIMRSIS